MVKKIISPRKMAIMKISASFLHGIDAPVDRWNFVESTVHGRVSGGSLVRGFTCPWFGVHLSGGSLVWGSIVRGSLVCTFRLLWLSGSGPPLPGCAIPRVRHSQGAPLDSISEHFVPRTYFPKSQHIEHFK